MNQETKPAEKPKAVKPAINKEVLEAKMADKQKNIDDKKLVKK